MEQAPSFKGGVGATAHIHCPPWGSNLVSSQELLSGGPFGAASSLRDQDAPAEE